MDRRAYVILYNVLAQISAQQNDQYGATYSICFKACPPLKKWGFGQYFLFKTW